MVRDLHREQTVGEESHAPAPRQDTIDAPAHDPLNDPTETIVAISTPPGRGGIGIVRLSGPRAARIATGMLRLRTPLAHAQARFAEVLDPDFSPQIQTANAVESDDKSVPSEAAAIEQAAIDEAIVTFFAAPNSYTGEDLVEIAAHGSPVVLESLIRQALLRGAILAEPGEFTERAFLSGRIDLTQAEGVRDLIEAQTLYQVRVAARQLGGALSRRVAPIKQSLVELIALLEAGIDFAEDDIDVAPDTDILVRIDIIRRQLQPVETSFAHGRIVHAGLTLAIVGRPNVGKSSLFNRLVERERAIVTAAAGTTRDLVTERVSLEGIPIDLIDTAGLREILPKPIPGSLHQTIDEAEAIGIRKSREALAEADIVLVVVDATTPLAEDELALLDSLQTRRVLIVANKADLLAPCGPAPQPDSGSPANSPAESVTETTSNSELPNGPLRAGSGVAPQVTTSALTGQGIPELRRQMLLLICGTSAEEPAGMLTNLRQHHAVSAALASLNSATEAVHHRTPHEMLLLDLYASLRHLDSLTGATTPDDVLNLIFSTFCIGK